MVFLNQFYDLSSKCLIYFYTVTGTEINAPKEILPQAQGSLLNNSKARRSQWLN